MDLSSEKDYDLRGIFHDIKEPEEEIYFPLPKIETPIKETGEKISLPATRIETILRESGVFFGTNNERNKNNLPELTADENLNLIAKRRAEDMASKQYFAYYSPEGRGVKDEAENLNYQFITIGENIALGDIKDDKALVTAWMNSPDHRDNILNEKYTRIGVDNLKKQNFKAEILGSRFRCLLEIYPNAPLQT